MDIAIQVADLDDKRIDGTRVYMLNMLRRFGTIDHDDQFFLYHRYHFNPDLTPPTFDNYTVKKLWSPLRWTQTRFAAEIMKTSPERLWMPMHALPAIRRRKMQTIVTIHDLAFKLFPQHFPRKDYYKITLLTDYAVKNADRLIAISHATKRDLIRFYPRIDEKKISVVHHGYDEALFAQTIEREEVGTILQSYELERDDYILYTGAIQPRKNIITLVRAFERVKHYHSSLRLVIAGAKAWQWHATMDEIRKSKCRKDILVTGTVDFDHLAILYQNAAAFVFPSLYEGFGIPLLEAFAAGTPVICARNSSLEEVGGKAAVYFDAQKADELAQKIREVIGNEALRKGMIAEGHEQRKNFSWDKCARETLDVIRGDA